MVRYARIVSRFHAHFNGGNTLYHLLLQRSPICVWVGECSAKLGRNFGQHPTRALYAFGQCGEQRWLPGVGECASKLRVERSERIGDQPTGLRVFRL